MWPLAATTLRVAWTRPIATATELRVRSSIGIGTNDVAAAEVAIASASRAAHRPAHPLIERRGSRCVRAMGLSSPRLAGYGTCLAYRAGGAIVNANGAMAR